VGLARYEAGKLVAQLESTLDPGIPILPEAAAIHGITDDMVKGAHSPEEFFDQPYVREIMAGAQPGAYNAPFDRNFMPVNVLPDDCWPWLDAMVVTQVVDQYARGAGRFKLTSACERHGIPLANAHSALADATAAGALFYTLLRLVNGGPLMPLGRCLTWIESERAKQWYEFHNWMSKQP
jgi:DNA polymerase III epsilon subunit-like protein